jgi:GT2 family glycosyltransferase
MAASDPGAGSGDLSVSVVISAYTDERWDALCEAVASVQAQTRRAHQVIVSVDHNPALLERARATWPDGSVVLVENAGTRGLSGARNAGIEAASGDIVAFLDDDAAAEPDWLANLAPVFDDPAVASAGGSLVPVWIEEQPGSFPEEFNWVIGCSYTGMPTTTADVRNAIGANMAFRRTELDAVGGFVSGIGRERGLPMGCEETEISIRVRQRRPGTRIVYEPSAQVRHLVPAGRGTWAYFFRRCWAEGQSKALLTTLVGRQDGLESERTYATRTLPLGVLRGLRDAMRGDASGIGRAAAIVGGLLATAAGYLRGQVLRARVS